MENNCKTCKFDIKFEFEEPCKTCINVTYLSSFGNVSTQWQPKEEKPLKGNLIHHKPHVLGNHKPKKETPKPITYTREEVLELMREAYDEGYSHEDNMSCKTILDNFDKLKNQKEDA